VSPVTPNFSLEAQPEVFFSTSETSDAVAYAVETGRARKLGPRLYTKSMTAPPEDIARRNWAVITAGYFPSAVITGRTAFSFKPAEDGSVFVSSAQARTINLPGLWLRSQRGPGVQEGDVPFMGQSLFMSSRPRAFLENLKPSRTRGGAVPRTLNRAEVEERLEEYGRYDPGSLNRLRDEARALTGPLHAERELETLSDLIGALLRTRDVELSSPRAKAAARGEPFDPFRIDTFEQLANHLLTVGLPALSENPGDDVSVLAFYEAYFSNYIEGTEFTLEEAREIVFEGFVPQQRPEDAHDILGTYQLVGDGYQRSRVPSTADDLIEILQDQHRIMLAERPEIGPGRWKQLNNRVGGHEFVDHRLVEGTLRQAFRFYASLPAGFARAAFAMYLVSEVHPFADGNGRTARVLMNSELTAAGQQRIIVTTHDRGDYLASLRGMSNSLNMPAYVTVLAALQRRTADIDFSTLASAERDLNERRAFTDPDEDRSALTPMFGAANSS
jgi:fido (protein-threonine AMPylation protein)